MQAHRSAGQQKEWDWLPRYMPKNVPHILSSEQDDTFGGSAGCREMLEMFSLGESRRLPADVKR